LREDGIEPLYHFAESNSKPTLTDQVPTRDSLNGK
jgi:hypothetical protein